MKTYGAVDQWRYEWNLEKRWCISSYKLTMEFKLFFDQQTPHKTGVGQYRLQIETVKQMLQLLSLFLRGCWRHLRWKQSMCSLFGCFEFVNETQAHNNNEKIVLSTCRAPVQPVVQQFSLLYCNIRNYYNRTRVRTDDFILDQRSYVHAFGWMARSAFAKFSFAKSMNACFFLKNTISIDTPEIFPSWKTEHHCHWVRYCGHWRIVW